MNTYTTQEMTRFKRIFFGAGKNAIAIARSADAIVDAATGLMNSYEDDVRRLQPGPLEPAEKETIWNWDDQAGEPLEIEIQRGTPDDLRRQYPDMISKVQGTRNDAASARAALCNAIDDFNRERSTTAYQRLDAAVRSWVFAVELAEGLLVNLQSLELAIADDMQRAGEDISHVHWLTITPVNGETEDEQQHAE